MDVSQISYGKYQALKSYLSTLFPLGHQNLILYEVIKINIFQNSIFIRTYQFFRAKKKTLICLFGGFKIHESQEKKTIEVLDVF